MQQKESRIYAGSGVSQTPIKTVYDERRLVYYGIDTDKKDFMERRLIHAVVENSKIDR